MQTETFQAALVELISLAGRQTVAIMCAEAVPWRCHRSLVTDALIAQGVPVFHIMSSNTTTAATLHAFAEVLDEHVSYPAATTGAEPAFGTQRAPRRSTRPPTIAAAPLRRVLCRVCTLVRAWYCHLGSIV